MSRFTVYMDKENSSNTAVANPTSMQSIRSAPIGKSFQSKEHTWTGPRRALGTLNTENNRGVKSADLDVVKKNALRQLQKSTQKESSCKAEQSKKGEKVVTQNANTAMELEDCEEMESMFPYNEQKEDDFEDIWPKAERPSEYMTEFSCWRPRCTFSNRFKSPSCSEEPSGYVSAEDSEDDLIREDDSDRDDTAASPPLQDITLPQLNLSQSDFPDIFSDLLP